MIKKKRVGTNVVTLFKGRMYSRINVDDKEWIRILEVINDYEEKQSTTYKVDSTELMIAIDQKHYDAHKELKKEIQNFVSSLGLEDDLNKRIRKAKRIKDISGYFEYDENGLCYLKGFKTPMNKIMIDSILDAHYNPNSRFTVESLINFWKYLILNPDKHVRKGLFDWIKNSQFSITEDGNIIAYRNVNIKKDSNNLNNFVTEEWLKIKRWKKSPANYAVCKKKEGYYLVDLTKVDTLNCKSKIGILGDLYKNLGTSDSTVYTDQYTGKMNIKIGEEVSMPRQECDNDPNSSCSRGLHAKSKNYGLNLGSELLVILVNPWNIVAIPHYDNTKFRTCAYFPVGKAELKDNKLVEFEKGTYDIPYKGIESLKTMFKHYDLRELQDKGEVSTEIDTEDFDLIVNAKDIIDKRTIIL